MAVPTHNDVQFKIRIPADLKKRIDDAAHANSRSTTAEIVAVLEREYPPPLPDDIEDKAAAMLVALARKIRAKNPKPGSFRDIQAKKYEDFARSIISGDPNSDD